jgi:anti-sigma factor ChrR (cupin superfamily)
MKINADLSRPAVEYSEQLPWAASPLAGVERRMLERDGDEVARATSIVRYAPQSYFDHHAHDLGEEFFVLEGVFSDEMGDFPAGMYVRNPPGSRHKPHSDAGCTIFVKLRQFEPADREYVRIDTTTAAWSPGITSGLSALPLHVHGHERVAALRLESRTQLDRMSHPGGVEIFVLDGVLEDEHGRYPKGTWLRNPPGSHHQPFSNEGCTLYVKIGHLGGRPVEGPTFLD